MPPPKTRFSSLLPKTKRGTPSLGICASETGWIFWKVPTPTGERFFSAGRTSTSSSVFHSSQSGHLPSHFICTLPHSEQTYWTLFCVFVFTTPIIPLAQPNICADSLYVLLPLASIRRRRSAGLLKSCNLSVKGVLSF
jgi:hypothetical protein